MEMFLRRLSVPRGWLGGIGHRRRRAMVWTVLVVLWLCSVGTGLAWLMAYDNTPGMIADAPAGWPAGSALARDPAGPTLIVLAHPRCDCTRASISELAELLARVRQRPRTFVVFIRPGGVNGAWENTSVWDQATEIPGVTVIRDDNGAEAEGFGVHTSGQTLLYDPHGRLVYSGGITGARGKSGNNAGRSALVELINGARPRGGSTPVFGCSLFSSAKRQPKVQAYADGY
jgi:hypothetical protein